MILAGFGVTWGRFFDFAEIVWQLHLFGFLVFESTPHDFQMTSKEGNAHNFLRGVMALYQTTATRYEPITFHTERELTHSSICLGGGGCT